ncbi:ATP-binding protein [Streptomyces sp. NPDC056401]|uniref:ATP-binding protein n=1 Tax=Streptomyces TaxID=1883 RepID=UPI0035D8D97D
MNTLVANLRLAATSTAVSCSRVFIAHTLRQWNIPDLIDDAQLVVSELVTNSVKATGVMTPSPTWAELEGLKLLHVALFAHGHSVTIQVWDDSKEPPVKTGAGQDDEAEQGRGLFIVEALALNVGCFFPRNGGKVVWAEMSAKGKAQDLPRRVRKPLENILLPESDPVLLRLLLEGLQKL